MKIYLTQHGEAVSKDIDPDRPLSERGLEDIKGIAAQLHTVSVSRVLHSTKTRARQTAQILATTIMPDGQLAVTDDINPNDAVEPFAARLAALTGDTAVVGHLPFMAKLVAYLVAGDGTQQIVSYQPGTIVCLEAEENRIWRIAWMLRPNLVPGSRTAPR